MARTETIIHARPDAVFAVLADARAFPGFVVGAKRVRYFDPRWPEPGTTIHHTVGVGPLAIRDETEATTCDPPHLLVVRPKIRPFVTAETSFRLEPHGEEDTLLRVDEYAVDGPLAPVWPGPLDGLMALRNRRVVRRLARMAEARQAVQRLDGSDGGDPRSEDPRLGDRPTAD
ncbi:MAG TPA: SRPBCC family protein [Acidimicrobiales bacterium]